MRDPSIARKARFTDIRYAQVWEDADILLAGLGQSRGASLVSICSAGDNALAMLLLDPERIFVADMSAAQIECLKFRLAAFRHLDHAGVLELMGSRPSARRRDLFDKIAGTLPQSSQAFWSPRRGTVAAHGLGGIGKFERYLRIFRKYLLPVVHDRATIDALLSRRAKCERVRFFQTRWNSWRWRLLLQLFCSQFVLGHLGRDPTFFDYAMGSVPEHASRRIVHAIADTDPSDNPYLHWIMKGTHAAALPLAYRAEHFETIQSRLDRIEVHQSSLESLLYRTGRIDGFNLSDIFEYMSETEFERAYGHIVNAANPGARLVYWNMMAPRRAPSAYANRVHRITSAEQAGKAADKAFFYSDFVVEEVR
jgi:S-adenosylmethionine-diacylglycerol 3-amino-3-carboxypropyl transferase